ncbi:MAG: peptidoglycan DD-metalloendopeptidase family protein [Bacteroidota bacterium]
MRKGLFIALTLLLPALLIPGCLSGSQADPARETGEELNTILSPEFPEVYGIRLNGLEISYGEVKKNQFLSGILLPMGITQLQLAEISALPDEVFDVRKIRPGNRYALITRNDSLHTPAYFIYEKDLVNYAVITLGDSITASAGKKPVNAVTKKISGEITSSLWEAMKMEEANPMLAVELSEIYAWTIDFFGLQNGDQFKVIYDELYIDSVSAGIGTIHGAWFRHAGNVFWAIPFTQDSVRSFFDQDGNSLRKAFLKAPLRFSHISSGFSSSRLHPILKIRRPHHGVDYAAPEGTPVQAIGDGLVFKVAYESGGGNYVKIKHNSVYSSTYMHLRGFAKGIRSGVYVHQGDVIGYVGHTGLATGPHLDFRMYKNGQPVNPLNVEAPPVEPVKEENLLAFRTIRGLTLNALNSFK